MVSKGKNLPLNAPWIAIDIHIHEGSIITLQDSTMTFLDVQKTLITLVVAFPNDSLLNSASGYIFLDNGDEIVKDLD